MVEVIGIPHYEATNMTVRDYAKLETLNTVIRYEVMYNEAWIRDIL